MQLIKEIEKEELFFINRIKEILRLAENKTTDVEVCIKKTIGFSINVRNSVIENIEFNSDGVLCITVYNKFSKGTVSSKDFSLHGITNMLEMAVNIAHYSSSDFFNGLPDAKLLCFQKLDLDLFHPWEFNVENAIKLCILSEKEAFNFDKRVVNSEGSFFNSNITINVLGNSLGMLESYKSTCHSMYNCIVAQDENSMQRDFDYSIKRKLYDLEKPEILGRKTAKRVISRLGSRKIKTMKSPVIFSAEISHIFFSHLVNAISGDNIYQKSTFLINSLNKKIFPNWLSIEEKPHLKQGLGSKPFDAEGVITKSKYIIQNGILKTWLLNSYNARKLKLASTGNSGGIHNWLVSNNNISFKELLKKIDQGILITELMGQGVDIVSGNYSRGIVGFWIEKGNIAYPINEITVSGNLKNMWSNIVAISSDIDARNNIQCGSILLSEMQISGN